MDESHQRRFDNQPIDLLPARKAAALLGVKLRTLYAYASRGWLTSHPGEGRTRFYSREEVERLRTRHDARKGHTAVAAGALRWGEPVLESALTRIDPRRPVLPRPTRRWSWRRAAPPFEAVAELLWSGSLPAGRPRWPADGMGLPPSRLRALVPPGEPPLTALQVAVPMLAARDPSRFGAPPMASELARARQLLSRLAACASLSTAAEAAARCRAWRAH